MRSDELIVLKIGGSVLRDRDSLTRATHEVYRWRRRGAGVVVVVSALEGETDRLMSEARAAHAEPEAGACAALLATGELRSAALLALAIGRVGLRAEVLTPHQVGMRVTGSGLDAEPVRVDALALRTALDAVGVVVVPGFVGIGERGDLRTLGRGGSDLSAIVIAHALGAARCRLVKDVPGLFDRDPNSPGPRARLLSRITFDDALRLDGGIIQHKAVRFARQRAMGFEVAGLHTGPSTRIGAPATRLAGEQAEAPPLRVGLLGLGTVGSGVLALLGAMPDRFRVVGAVCRDHRAAEARGVDPRILQRDAEGLVPECDVIVEALGGLEPAATIVRRALRRGVHTVSANKRMLAAHLPALRACATAGGAMLRFGAAVGGAAPVLEAAEALADGGIIGFQGVLNGTTNFVLDSLRAGSTLEGALALARARGLAEADPSRDLSGADAADKLALVLGVCTRGAEFIDPRDIECEPFPLAAPAHRPGRAVVRQIGKLDLTVSPARARVGLRELHAAHPLADVLAEENAAAFTLRDGTVRVVRGTGAGRWPTAEAVVADLLDIWRDSAAPGERPERARRHPAEAVAAG
ncbi:MAG: hypothetical protein KF869_01045 [Phycisphaeraceae bacterium]|nr:hypothetical protein [Phycisphaeraceae bacterium]